jgi:hypothetical protein
MPYSKAVIYKIYNIDEPEKLYVGSTANSIWRRLYSHKSMSKKGKTFFYTEVRRLGWNKFNIEVIENFPCNNKQELLAEEERVRYETNAYYNTWRAYITEEQRKKEMKEYNKIYYEENKRELQEHNKSYRDNHKEYIKERDKKYREEHPVEMMERRKKYYEEHKKEQNAYSKKYYRENREWAYAYNKKYQQDNKERLTKQKAKYYQDHKEEFKERNRKRKSQSF